MEGLYRPTIVMKKLGPRIIDDLFRAAHAADPDADLIYNEYDVLQGGAKADRMYTIVQGLLQRGVPVHTVGFQGHVVGKEIYPKTEAVRGRIKRSLKRFADLGVKVSAICPGYIKTRIFEDSKFVGMDVQDEIDNMPAWLGITPDECAKRILRGVERNKAIIPITGMAWVLWVLMRVSPNAVMALMPRQLRRSRIRLRNVESKN